MIKKLFTALLFFAASWRAASQDSVRITHSFVAVPFEGFVQYIESATPYRFYFSCCGYRQFPGNN